MKPLTPTERLLAQIDKRGPDECWPWKGKTHPLYGYGTFNWHTRPARHTSAHRAAYELLIGPIPEGLTVDHTCHNGSGCAGGPTCPHRICMNPAHFEAVTGPVNTRRAGNAAKTHCKHGHPFNEKNTYRRPTGGRACIACRDLRQGRSEARHYDHEAIRAALDEAVRRAS